MKIFKATAITVFLIMILNGCSHNTKDGRKIYEFGSDVKIQTGELFPNPKILLKFKNNNKECSANFRLEFPSEESKELNIAVLKASSYICFNSKEIHTMKDLKYRTAVGAGTNLFLAYNQNKEYILGHELRLLQKADINITIDNYIEGLDEIGKVFFELDKTKKYVVVEIK